MRENFEEFVVPLSHVDLICKDSKIEPEKITNVYLYGSRLDGSAESTSDYDLMLVGEIEEPPLDFIVKKDPYFYQFERKSIEIEKRKYDYIIHSNINFEKLLEINFLMFVEPLYSEAKYKTINKIDYKKMFIEKFLQVRKIKKALRNITNKSTAVYSKFKQNKIDSKFDGKWVLKKIFNTLRYHKSCLNFLLTNDFSGWGQLSDTKSSIFKRYYEEGDNCVDQIYQTLSKDVSIISKQINEFK